MAKYVQKAIPDRIKFSSRASINVKDHWYTVEYGEERQITNYEEVDIDKEKQLLIDSCNKIVDEQITDILEAFRKN